MFPPFFAQKNEHEYEKVLDIDIKAAAEAALGKELTQNLLSVVFDYDGNLWFATGGFRIYPECEQQGVLGYIAHSAIEAILNGEQADLSKAVFVYGLALGEGAENGIAASKGGAVILTNQNSQNLIFQVHKNTFFLDAVDLFRYNKNDSKTHSISR